MKNNVGEQQKFKPFISAEKILPEFTLTSILLGIFLWRDELCRSEWWSFQCADRDRNN